VGMELTTLLVVGTDKIVIQSHTMTKIELGDLEVGNYLVIVFRVEDLFRITFAKFSYLCLKDKLFSLVFWPALLKDIFISKD
jgi:hypothetical protein